MKTINRDSYLNRLIGMKENGMIKVITGIKGAGKTYLVFKLYYEYLLSIGVEEENIIRISLDDPEYEELRDAEKLYEFVNDKLKNNDRMHYVFIDEIQYAIKRENIKSDDYLPLYGVLNSFLHMDNADVYAISSNSKLISKDVRTEFRGRSDELKVYPLSFREYFDYVGGYQENAYEEYALYGGLPGVLSKNTAEEKKEYLTCLFDEVYLKEIKDRYNIRYPEVMKQLVKILCSSVGSLTDSSKLAKVLQSNYGVKTDADTVSSYLDYLDDYFLFSKAIRYDIKRKRYFPYPSKYYCTDIGLMNAVLGFSNPDQDKILENIVYNELRSRGYSVDVGVVPIKSRDEEGRQHLFRHEIDFVFDAGTDRYYIQTALEAYDRETWREPIRPLLSTGDSFRKILVSKSYGQTSFDFDGILHTNIYDFLLNEDIVSRRL